MICNGSVTVSFLRYLRTAPQLKLRKYCHLLNPSTTGVRLHQNTCTVLKYCSGSLYYRLCLVSYLLCNLFRPDGSIVQRLRSTVYRTFCCTLFGLVLHIVHRFGPVRCIVSFLGSVLCIVHFLVLYYDCTLKF